ncbi:MAG: ABC transporter permease, partial [Acidiferrobacterales bacterium]
MYAYIVKRLLLMIPTLFGAAVLVFFLLRAVPGDPCEIRLAGTGLYADPAEIELCQKNLGLDRPLYAQFFEFVGGYFTGDLGDSMWTGRPITYEIGLRFQLSLQVAIMATIVSVIIAIPLGAISAIKQDTWIDYVVRTFSIAGIAIPSFWLGIMIILGLLIITQQWFGTPWMPPIDYVSP